MAVASSPASGEEPLFDTLKGKLKTQTFNVGALVQVVGIVHSGSENELNNGFALANVRLSVGGELDRGFGYFFQTSFIKSPAFLDANLSHRQTGLLMSRLGAFKAPFSAEFLTSAANIDFVNRSQGVTAFVPGRQIGFQVSGKGEMGFGYAVGIFNGNGIGTITNDNDDVMSNLRLTFSRSPGEDKLFQLGVSGAHSRDTNAQIGFRITGDFIAEGYTGERLLGGADLRLEYARWLLASEVIGGKFDPRGAEQVEPYGYYVTVGYDVRNNVQLLARWDSFRADGALQDSDLAVGGLNYWPSGPTELQLNVVVPTRTSSENVELLLNIQVAF